MTPDRHYEIPEVPVTLTPEQMKSFAAAIAKQAVDEFLHQVYSNVGKSLMEKIFYVGLACLITWYFATKGIPYTLGGPK